MPRSGQGWARREACWEWVQQTGKQWLGVTSCSGVTSLDRNILSDLVSPGQGSLPARSLDLDFPHRQRQPCGEWLCGRRKCLCQAWVLWPRTLTLGTDGAPGKGGLGLVPGL